MPLRPSAAIQLNTKKKKGKKIKEKKKKRGTFLKRKQIQMISVGREVYEAAVMLWIQRGL